jgi:hypothetical protein
MATATRKENPISIPPTVYTSSAVLHTLPDWCGQLSWSRAQPGKVRPGLGPDTGEPGPPASAVEAGAWPSACENCRHHLAPPDSIPHRNAIRVLCSNCAWRHTPVGPSMIAVVSVPSWSSEEGRILWTRHAVIRTDPTSSGGVGLLCFGAQPVVIFPLLWAVAMRRCLRAASVPGCATATERIIATAFVALCSRMTLQQVEGRSPWVTKVDAPAGAMIQLVDAGWNPGDFTATCVYVWQRDMVGTPRAHNGGTPPTAGAQCVCRVGKTCRSCFASSTRGRPSVSGTLNKGAIAVHLVTRVAGGESLSAGI